ncbi:MAG TPA: hypothetical protein DEO84_10035, partial [candidate division Zixibacteria bacterium]|nr:hypothetical protein [candidate division Zixibacteria bacterium]
GTTIQIDIAYPLIKINQCLITRIKPGVLFKKLMNQHNASCFVSLFLMAQDNQSILEISIIFRAVALY